MKYDKGSFITVPTSSIIGIGIGPQALYMWLCSFANNDGSCFPSRSILAKNIGCSERAIDGYLDELIELGLVVKEARYSNNKQISNNYYLPLGVAKYARGVAESAPTPSQNLRTELNPLLTQSTYTSEAPLRVESDSDKPPKKERKDTAYLQVFALWGDYPLNWKKNVSQISSAKNLLIETDLSEMKKALALYEKYKNYPFCPKIRSPWDLDTKWDSLLDFKPKHV